jgi:8-oxo-dGTP pyrophosphatase MutT (NUDIX family)
LIAAAVVLRETDRKVLLLKRADTHTTNPGKWCFVTGYIEPGESAEHAAIRELREELGISAVPVKSGEMVLVKVSSALELHVFPYLFVLQDFPVNLDREHTTYEWIVPASIRQYDIVQQLDDDLKSLGLL